MKLEISKVVWPLKRPFKISRGTEYDVQCIHVVLTDTYGRVGRGEAIGVSYAGETVDSMTAQICNVATMVEQSESPNELRAQLAKALPAGGARNALDCALWDLAAKQTGMSAWRAAGLREFKAVETAFTLGMMDEAELRLSAAAAKQHTVLKIKTDLNQGIDPVRIVHEQAPHAKLIVDPNQAWSAGTLLRNADALSAMNVVLLEQPLAVDDDEALRNLRLPIPVAADEAFVDSDSIPSFIGKYQVLNIKLDKTGGLTEALKATLVGKQHGFKLMVGCMEGSSLSMAPGMIVAQLCEFVDLDGPLLQAADCAHAMRYEWSRVEPPTPALWG
jgi:L-Ala-D/L-Glu epimerase